MKRDIKKSIIKKKLSDVITSKRDANWAEKAWKVSWTYIRTVVDTAHEAFVILDSNFCVIAANKTFYRTFLVTEAETEDKPFYGLGDGQWDIPGLRRLLEDVLPKDTFFKGFEVDHIFPIIGRKIILLNARRIYLTNDTSTSLESIILLAMEDITEITTIAIKLAKQTKEYETKMIQRTKELEANIATLRKT